MRKTAILIAIIGLLAFLGCDSQFEQSQKKETKPESASTMSDSAKTARAEMIERIMAKTVAVTPQTNNFWELIATRGTNKFVYMPWSKMQDKGNFVKVIRELRSRQIGYISIYFYDNKMYTPRSFPMTDQQMLHWRARYFCIPNVGIEKLVLISIVDRSTSPPKLKEIQISDIKF